ncbi:Putative glutamine amidotransferase [Thalassocella blandensis]|nr:Putative glutamine amidotransferase [Thalassocella blandensis]
MPQSTQRPCIAVTGPVSKFPFGWWAAKFCLNLCQVQAKYFTARSTRENFTCQGIVIGGGDDIDPQHYGIIGDAGASYDRERDAFELQMVEYALKANIPILGICRGAQLINVALGGSLHQDIRPHRQHTPNRNSIFPIKQALLQQNTMLKKLYRGDQFAINSLHNQAIDRVASNLQVAAVDEDGFVQAVESPNQFILGVQWHPEYLPYLRNQRRLFQYFVEAVRMSHHQMQLKTEISGDHAQAPK